MKEQCKQAVARALNKSTLSQQEAKDIENRVRDAMKNRAKQDRQKWRNLSDAEKLKEAAEQVAQDIQAQTQRKLETAKQDILKQSKNIAELDHPTLPPSEVLDRKVAAHGDMSGVQSVSSNARAIASLYRGEITDFYTNIKDGLGMFTNKDLVKDIIRERFKEQTNNSSAKEISDKLGEVFENMRDRFNRNGGDIGLLDDWGIPQSHGPEKMAIAGKDQWVNDAMPLINRDKYVKEDGSLYSDKEVKDLLEYAFDTITSNGANKIDVGKANHQGASKTTNKHSESRVLHFKDADAWLDYQDKYGGKQFVDVIESHIVSMSKDIALVEMFGSNPRSAFKILKDAARKKDWKNGVDQDKSKASLSRSQDMFDEFLGGNVERQSIANMGLAYRALNVASMLGGTTLSAATDQAMIAKTAQVHGLSYWKSFGEIVTQLNPKNKEDREFAHSLGMATEEMIGTINRWSDDGLTSVHGKSEKIARASSTIATQVLRISGLNAITAAGKVGFTKVLMNKYGELSRSKAWSDLSPIDREIMEGTGLSERAWDVMRLADPIIDRQGNQLMAPKSIYAIPDDVLLGAMDKDVKAVVDDVKNQVDDLNNRNTIDDQRIATRMQKTDDIKRSLSQRLLDYANRKDAKAQAEKQALQDRIDLLDAQKDYAAAQSDLNTYIRNADSKDDLKAFFDNITQGKFADNLAANAKKLGHELEALDNKVSQKSLALQQKVKAMDKEIQAKFESFSDLLNNKKIKPEKLAEYEDQLSKRLASYANRRDVIASKEADALNDLKQIVSDRKDALTKDAEIKKASEQSKVKNKTDAKIDRTIENNTTKDYKAGEDIGRRLGSSERRMTELRAKMRQADSEANKAISQKFNELDTRVQKLDDAFTQYQTNVAERQAKRQAVMDRLNNSIDDRKKNLAKKIRDEVATQLQTHYLDEQGMAVIEAGLRERSKLQIGKKGTATGEIWRSMTQFKSFPMAFLMRHGSRAFSRPTLQGKAAYMLSLVAMTSLLGAFVVQMKEIANGNDPQTMWDGENQVLLGINKDFLKRSIAQGGGLSFLGDILVAGMDSTGRDVNSFINGMLGGDVKAIMGLTVGNVSQSLEGKETNWENEAFKLAKSKIPAQNLWYTKAATNRILFDELQDTISPGYREKALRRAERRFDRSRFWGDDITDIRAPDFDRVIK